MGDGRALTAQALIRAALEVNGLGRGDGERRRVGIAGERAGAKLGTAHRVDVAYFHIVGGGGNHVGAYVINRVGKKTAGLQVVPGVAELAFVTATLVDNAVLLKAFGQADFRRLSGSDARLLGFVQLNLGIAVLAGAHQGEVDGVIEVGFLGLVGKGVFLGAVTREGELPSFLGAVLVAQAIGCTIEHVVFDLGVLSLGEDGGGRIQITAGAYVHAVGHKLLAVGVNMLQGNFLRAGIGLGLRNAIDALLGGFRGKLYLGACSQRRVNLVVDLDRRAQLNRLLLALGDRVAIAVEGVAFFVNVDHRSGGAGALVNLLIGNVQDAVLQSGSDLVASHQAIGVIAANDLRGCGDGKLGLGSLGGTDADHALLDGAHGLAVDLHAHGIGLKGLQGRSTLAIRGLGLVEIQGDVAAVLGKVGFLGIQLHDAEGVVGLLEAILHVGGYHFVVHQDVGIQGVARKPGHGDAFKGVATDLQGVGATDNKIAPAFGGNRSLIRKRRCRSQRRCLAERHQRYRQRKHRTASEK